MNQPPELVRAIAQPCGYCGRPMRGKYRPSRDHIKPRHLGYTFADGNKIISCVICNAEKGHRTLYQFYLYCRRERLLLLQSPNTRAFYLADRRVKILTAMIADYVRCDLSLVVQRRTVNVE